MQPLPGDLTCWPRIFHVPDFDISVPHISRVYDYWLGGKDNFAADRGCCTTMAGMRCCRSWAVLT